MISNGQIWVINPDGTGRTQLTDAPLPSNNDDPVGSPDGQKIPFSINRTGSQVLCPMAAEGPISESSRAALAARCPEMPHDSRFGKALR